MKILIICSKRFYNRIPEIKTILEDSGHEIFLPNCFDDPETEGRYKDLGNEAHAAWKGGMIKHSTGVIEASDAVLVLNFEKDGIKNYIGGATFLEMYDAFRLNKKIYLYHDIPEGILHDEIVGFAPIVLYGELALIS